MNEWDLKQEFEAGVFSDQVPGGRCSVTLHCEAAGLKAVTESGQEFFLRYDQMQLELGGSSGRMFFCRNADRSLTLFCEDRQFRAALELHSSTLLSEQLAGISADRKSDRSRGRSILLLSLLALGLLLYGGYYAALALGRVAVKTLPVQVDEQIGKLAYSQMDHGGPEITDPLIVDACREIVRQLEPHSALAGLKFEIKVIDSEDVNAFCLPGGKMVIFTGLLKSARDARRSCRRDQPRNGSRHAATWPANGGTVRGCHCRSTAHDRRRRRTCGTRCRTGSAGGAHQLQS
jgi:hypothetical protein